MNDNSRGQENNSSKINWQDSKIKWIDEPIEEPFSKKIKWNQQYIQPQLKITRNNAQEQNLSNPEFFLH
jgi:hypothetical protein